LPPAILATVWEALDLFAHLAEERAARLLVAPRLQRGEEDTAQRVRRAQ